MQPKRREYVVSTTRLYPAPRERVFECWTRAEHLAHWVAPKGFTLHDGQAEARSGGAFRLTMRAPWGDSYRVRGSYLEVVAPERLVIRCFAADEQGVERLEETIEVALVVEAKGTRLTLRAVAGGQGPEAERMLAGMEQGWNETLDRLGDRAKESNA